MILAHGGREIEKAPFIYRARRPQDATGAHLDHTRQHRPSRRETATRSPWPFLVDLTGWARRERAGMLIFSTYREGRKTDIGPPGACRHRERAAADRRPIMPRRHASTYS